jgi:ribonuclease HI
LTAIVEIYTDGACRGNPGPGGWGALLIAGKHRKSLHGGEHETTNNRMELTAAIEALNALYGTRRVILHTDSKYVKEGIESWLANWKARGWKTSNRKPVKNQDLWLALDEAVSRHQLEWKWVKGHSDDPGNDAADARANRGIDEL